MAFKSWLDYSNVHKRTGILPDVVHKLSLRFIIDSASDVKFEHLLCEICRVKNFSRSLARSETFWITILSKAKTQFPGSLILAIISLIMHCRRNELIKMLEIGVLQKLSAVFSDECIAKIFVIFS